MNDLDVRVMKLTNGDTVIAEFVGEGEYGIDVANPLAVSNKFHEGYMGTVLHQWISISDDEIYSLAYHSLICVTMCRPDVNEHYQNVVASIVKKQDGLDDAFEVETMDEIDDRHVQEAFKHFGPSANTVFN